MTFEDIYRDANDSPLLSQPQVGHGDAFFVRLHSVAVQPTLVMLNEGKHPGLEYKLAASGTCMRIILPHDLTDIVL